MAQTLFSPSPSFPSYTPSSPDSTPLRLLAFSVAEAALQSDPGSPSFGATVIMSPRLHTRDPGSRTNDWVREPFNVGGPRSAAEDAGRLTKRRPLWDMAERAKERKERERASPAHTDSVLPPSPPISPANHKFILPANSALVSPIAANHQHASPPSLNLSERFPLYTRSAEPSPTNATFAALDQARPPPEFFPRLSAREFSARAHDLSTSTKHQRAKSDLGPPEVETSPSQLLRSQVKIQLPSRHSSRLPSLKQIQAKMSVIHRRGASVGSVPLPRIRQVLHSASEESIEILKTPTDDDPRAEGRIKLNSIFSRRPPTPPSPSAKESRLAPFLLQRTRGRLANASPVSLPPIVIDEATRPSFNIASPSFEFRRSTPPPIVTLTPDRATFPFGMASPTRSLFNLAVSTPPSHSSDPLTSTSSPTGSLRSTSSASPTLSVPIITCTPAPVKVVKNGVEHDSDEEEGEVVVFDGEVDDVKNREERERSGREMRDRLMLRRRSE